MGFLRQFPWGVQWEIARYVNTGFGYDRFTISKLSEWKGKDNSAAPDVTKFVEAKRKADMEAAAAVSNGKRGKSKVIDGNDDYMSPEYEAAYAREQSAKVRISPPGMPMC